MFVWIIYYSPHLLHLWMIFRLLLKTLDKVFVYFYYIRFWFSFILSYSLWKCVSHRIIANQYFSAFHDFRPFPCNSNHPSVFPLPRDASCRVLLSLYYQPHCEDQTHARYLSSRCISVQHLLAELVVVLHYARGAASPLYPHQYSDPKKEEEEERTFVYIT